jgi:hypothetical protein
MSRDRSCLSPSFDHQRTGNMKKTTLLGTVRGITVLQSSTNIGFCLALAVARNVTETKISLKPYVVLKAAIGAHPAVQSKNNQARVLFHSLRVSGAAQRPRC